MNHVLLVLYEHSMCIQFICIFLVSLICDQKKQVDSRALLLCHLK